MKENGLTLIELIVVLVILGILGAAGAMLLPEAMGGYENARAEARLAEEGTLAMTVMTQSIRDAAPTSLVVNTRTVSFALCQPGATATATSTCSSGYGFAFSGGTLWQIRGQLTKRKGSHDKPITGKSNSAPLALNASGRFSPAGNPSQVTIALTLSNAMTATTLSWNRVVAVGSRAYVR
jgi:prepilin-type N-terminal cleavage/methylation domain-containing protein